MTLLQKVRRACLLIAASGALVLAAGACQDSEDSTADRRPESASDTPESGSDEPDYSEELELDSEGGDQGEQASPLPDNPPLGVPSEQASWRPVHSSLAFPSEASVEGDPVTIRFPKGPALSVVVTGRGSVVAVEDSNVLQIANGDGKLESVHLEGVNRLVRTVAAAESAVLLSSPSRLLAVSIPRGQVLWSTSQAGGTGPADLALHRGVAYSEQSGALTAVSLADGSLLWRSDSPRDYLGVEIAADDEAVVAKAHSRMVGYDPETGERLWELEADELPPTDRGSQAEGAFGTPKAGGGTVFTATDNTLAAIGSRSGDVSWHIDVAQPPKHGGIAVASVNLYYQTRDALVARRTTSGSEAWRHTLPGDAASGPVSPTMVGNRVAALTLVSSSRHELAYDSVISLFDIHGEQAGQRRIEGSYTSNLGVGRETLAVITRADRTPDEAGPWQLTVFD